jgi:hypothetical protein
MNPPLCPRFEITATHDNAPAPFILITFGQTEVDRLIGMLEAKGYKDIKAVQKNP